MSNRGREVREHTPMILTLLKDTTLSYSEIADKVNKIYGNDVGKGTIGYLKRRERIERPERDISSVSHIVQMYQTKEGLNSEFMEMVDDNLIDELKVDEDYSLDYPKMEENIRNVILERKAKVQSETPKKSRNSQENFVPIESIKQVLKVAKIQYKNKSLNENYQSHFKQVLDFIKSIQE